MKTSGPISIYLSLSRPVWTLPNSDMQTCFQRERCGAKRRTARREAPSVVQREAPSVEAARSAVHRARACAPSARTPKPRTSQNTDLQPNIFKPCPGSTGRTGEAGFSYILNPSTQVVGVAEPVGSFSSPRGREPPHPLLRPMNSQVFKQKLHGKCEIAQKLHGFCTHCITYV